MLDYEELAREARRAYWAAIGEPERAEQEPSPASLAGWVAVVDALKGRI